MGPKRRQGLCSHIDLSPPWGPRERERENKKTKDEILEYLLTVPKNLALPLHPVYNDGNTVGVQWWEKRCDSTSVHTQVAWMGAHAYSMEEFWMKYGHPQLLDREALFRFFFFFFFFDETHPTRRNRCFHAGHQMVFGGGLA